MTIHDIMAMTGVASRNTIHAWIEERGFPCPIEKGVGRSRFDRWERHTVEDWWHVNRRRAGRHPK
jgi:predicted DNA-binding transcriptional regulator AlpA